MNRLSLAVRTARPSRRWERRWSLRGGHLSIASAAAVTVLALLGPMLAPHDPLERAGESFTRPGRDFWFGTDDVGRDILSRVLNGVRTTWLAAVAVVLLGVLIGGAVGLVAGAGGGRVDRVLMAVTDLFLALPAPLLAIATVAALGPSLQSTLIALSIVWWPYYARLARAEVRIQATRPHVEAARLTGIGRIRLGVRHLLPGAVPTVLVAATLDVSVVILTLASLSFLGLGAPAPSPELGAMAARGASTVLDAWWIATVPALVVLVLGLVAALAGDATRDLVGARR